MLRPRIRLSTFLIAVAAPALMFGSLRFATDAWSGVVLMLTLAALAFAVVSAVYRRGSTRAFWLVFAVFGGMYTLMLAFMYWPDVPHRHDLPTTRVIDKLGERLAPPLVMPFGPFAPIASGGWMPLDPG